MEKSVEKKEIKHKQRMLKKLTAVEEMLLKNLQATTQLQKIAQVQLENKNYMNVNNINLNVSSHESNRLST